jgi:site-specific DNA recombinase
LKDHILVIAPHEGLVSSDIWLQCRKRLMANSGFDGTRKAKNTWLAGKIKCGRCGAGLMSLDSSTRVPYFRCRKRADRKSCEGCGTLRVREVEQSIYSEMVKKMAEFQTLTGGNSTKANPKLTALNVELAQVEAEIEKLLNTLTGEKPFCYPMLTAGLKNWTQNCNRWQKRWPT